MAQASHLGTRAKTAIGLLLVVVLGLLALVIRSSIVALTPESVVGQPIAEADDEIVQAAPLTLILKHGGVGSRIAHWVNARSSGTRAFKLHDRTFAPGSDVLTSEGQARAISFAQMMTAVPALRAGILVMSDDADAGLAQRRANRIRSTLVESGVPASSITTSSGQVEVGARRTGDPELIAILSKRAGSVR